MAFGFGFNKQKVLSAAEKFVQQGKLPNAITEYEKVLKADPKDLTVMNTVGDLYSRLGNVDKAVDCFKSVGDAYAAQGFTVKAIAMYKKLSKIKHSFEGVLRLAELYTQQGLFNDARAQYLQVAEEFLRSGELEQAVRIFQKTLEMDPDNVAMRSKLAEVYVRLGKKSEAWQIFTAAAETLRSRGQLEGAETILQRMLTLDPENSYALLMRGRTAMDAGDASAAIDYLEKVADIDNHPEALSALFNAYLQNGRLPEAKVSAGKLLTVHNDPAAIYRYAEAVAVSGQFDEALQVYNEYSDALLSSDPTRMMDSLHSIISHVQENASSLESILALFTKAGETSHTTEVYELLAHAYVQSGDLEKARDFYQKLTQLEPQNQLHAKNYQQIIGKVGGSTPKFISAEEGSILIEELETTAPFVDQRYEDEVALAIRGALTDAELFISYNMPDKAMGPLLAVLPKAPQDLRLNQRLASLHNRGERFAEAAICCRTLETIYHDAGYPEEATRYGELAARYEERAASAVAAPVVSRPLATKAQVEEVPVSSAPSVRGGLFFHTPAASKSTEAQAPEFDIQPSTIAETEIDLSGEWDGGATEESLPVQTSDANSHEAPVAAGENEEEAHIVAPSTPAADPAAVQEILEEIRFYIGHSLLDLAHGALAKLRQMNPDAEVVALMQQEIESATNAAATEGEPVSEISVEEIPAEALVEEPQVVEEPVAPYEPAAFETAFHEVPVAETFADEFPVAAAETHAEVGIYSEVEPPNENERLTVQSWPGFESETPVPAAPLQSLVADLESSLGNDFSSAATEEIADSVAEHTPVAAVDHEAISQHQKPYSEIAPEPHAVAAPHLETAIEAPMHDIPAPITSEAVSTDALGSIVSDLEVALGDNFLAEKAAEVVAHSTPESRSHVSQAAAPLVPPPAVMAAAAPGSSSAAWQHSTAFTNFKPTVPTPPPPVEETPAAKSENKIAAGIDLADMFGELKHELEEDAASTDEDPETHYSLGVAFREMGLLDEAIGELQKVCQTVEHGHPFPQILQTYTWLAQCFLDKGIPEAALRWYERALALPNLSPDTKMALHYELGCACETSGNRSTALNHFMEVYGSNIDYRDVAERIKALKS